MAADPLKKCSSPNCREINPATAEVCIRCGQSLPHRAATPASVAETLGEATYQEATRGYDERRPNALLRLPLLFFGPGAFFKHFPANPPTRGLILAAWIVGLSMCMGKLSFLQNSRALDSWPDYWSHVALGSLLPAYLIYLVGGWWYRIRLGWSEPVDLNKHLARCIYMYALLIMHLPSVLLTLIDATIYPTPRAALDSGDMWRLALLPGSVVLTFWSVYVSYHGVRTVFDVARWKARLWFFVLPCLFWGSLLVGIFAISMTEVGAGPPDTESRGQIDRPGFELAYPGNWLVDDSRGGHDPDQYFTIAPLLDHAEATFWIVDEWRSPEAATEELLNIYREDYVGGEVSRFEFWGPHTGVGASFSGVWEGDHYIVRIFTMATETHTLITVEIVDVSISEKMSPGFDLIRRTFRFKD